MMTFTTMPGRFENDLADKALQHFSFAVCFRLILIKR